MRAGVEARRNARTAQNRPQLEGALSAERITELARHYRLYGDTAAQNEIVIAFQPLVGKWARYYAARFSHMGYQEFISVGANALIRALNTFKPEKGSFGNHARTWVRSLMAEAGYESMSDVRIPYATRSKARSGRREIPVHALRAGVALVSDSAELDESDRGGITESAVSFAVSESDTSTDDRIDASAILTNLERYGLSERQRYIFREHFGRERTFASLAAEFGVSNARVQQLYQNGLSQIRTALGVRP